MCPYLSLHMFSYLDNNFRRIPETSLTPLGMLTTSKANSPSGSPISGRQYLDTLIFGVPHMYCFFQFQLSPHIGTPAPLHAHSSPTLPFPVPDVFVHANVLFNGI